MTEKNKKISRSKKAEIQFANITIFVLVCDGKNIEVPAKYCGTSVWSIIKRIAKGKGERTISHRFVGHDLICPASYIGQKIKFLGPKVKKGHEVSYPHQYSAAKDLALNKKYKIIDVRRKK